MVLSRTEKKELLITLGWFAWYSQNYWCHHQFDDKAKGRDCTNWGMSLDEAYEYETNPASKDRILTQIRIERSNANQ